MIKTALSFLLIAFTCSYAQVFDPQIIAQSSEHDFGDVAEGTSVTHNFVVSNSGGDVLKITKVRAGCGCTAASPEKSELAPGESTTIRVAFNSTGREGRQEKYVFVNSNDPKTPELKLKFTCNVVKQDKNVVNQMLPNYHLQPTSTISGK